MTEKPEQGARRPAGESWTERRIGSLIRLLTLLLLIVALHVGREVLVPLALAAFASVLLAPLVGRIQRTGIPNVVAVLAVVGVVTSCVGVVGFVATREVLRLAEELPSYRENIERRVRVLRSAGRDAFSRATHMVEDIQREIDEEDADSGILAVHAFGLLTGLRIEPEAEDSTANPTQEVRSALRRLFDGETFIPVQIRATHKTPLQAAKDFVGPLIGPLALGGVSLVFVIFFLLKRQDLFDRLVHLAGKGHIQVTSEALNEAGRRASGYLTAHVRLNIAYAIPVTVGLWWIGLPGAVLWGVLSGMLRFVPYIGPWTAALLPITLSLAVFEGWSEPLMVAGLFIALELVSNNILEPWLYGSSAGISTVAVLLAVLFWGWLWGPIGVVLSVPMTAVLVVLGRYVPQLTWLAVLLGDESTLAPAMRYYHRILSGSDEDAATLTELAMLHDGPLAAADEILLPAIALAKRDREQGALTLESADHFQSVVEGQIEQRSIADPSGERAPTGRGSLRCASLEGEADELAARVAAVTLVSEGFEAEVVSLGEATSPSDDPERHGPILLCAVAPTSHRTVRDACRAVLSANPGSELWVGLWGYQDLERMSSLVRRAGAHRVGSALRTLVTPLVAPRGEAEPSDGSEKALFGASPAPS